MSYRTRFVEWCQRPSKIKIRTYKSRNVVVLVTFSLLLATSITLGIWSYQVAFVPLAEYPFIAPETSLTIAVPSNPPWKECTIAATLKDENGNPLPNMDIRFLYCGTSLIGTDKTERARAKQEKL